LEKELKNYFYMKNECKYHSLYNFFGHCQNFVFGIRNKDKSFKTIKCFNNIKTFIRNLNAKKKLKYFFYEFIYFYLY